MNKLLIVLGFCVAFNASMAKNLAGSYTCFGHDSKDGDYASARVTLTLDAKHHTKSGDGYLFTLVESNHESYSGMAAYDGDENLAIYFANDAKDKKDDAGVGIAKITKTGFSKFYYEAKYDSDGVETCIKDKAK